MRLVWPEAVSNNVYSVAFTLRNWFTALCNDWFLRRPGLPELNRKTTSRREHGTTPNTFKLCEIMAPKFPWYNLDKDGDTDILVTSKWVHFCSTYFSPLTCTSNLCLQNDEHWCQIGTLHQARKICPADSFGLDFLCDEYLFDNSIDGS